jgi:hypothetical protein
MAPGVFLLPIFKPLFIHKFQKTGTKTGTLPKIILII